MTIYHSLADVGKIRCLKDPEKYCQGPECMAWMFKQNKEEGRNITDTGNGICGWLYAMAYFRDKNPNQQL